MKSEVIILGHKNPDTDSICSAIAYAYLKNKIDTENNYTAKRCGDVSKETAFVLEKFGVEAPQFQSNVRTQVSDIEIKKVPAVDKDMSIRKAYNFMKSNVATMLTIASEDGKGMGGVISLGDIAASDMNALDNTLLAVAKTPYKNIVETLEATVLCGDISGNFEKGKVVIGGSTPELLDEYLAADDLAIMSNRIETQFLAIENGVKCIILCFNSEAHEHIIKLAESKGCIMMRSPYDAYTCARLISKSIPISHLMSTENILEFRLDDFTDDVKNIMAKTRLRYFPVLDDNGEYIGQISKRSFLDMEKKKVILVDHNEKSQTVDGIENADILEIIDHHKLGSIETVNPVFFRNQPLGSTASIVYSMFLENGVEIPKHIAGILFSAIVSDTLMFRSPTCTFIDKQAAEALAKIAEVEIQEYSDEMFNAASDFEDFSDQDLFYRDYKDYSFLGVNVGIAQITAMNETTVNGVVERMSNYMKTIPPSRKVDIYIMMVTNIIDESSIIVYKGENALDLMKTAYGNEATTDRVYVKGVVSRKKQLIPNLMRALQQ